MYMFHKALNLNFKQGTKLEVTFQDGQVKLYDMSVLFDKYPQLEALKNRDFFLSGKLKSYGIIWNDKLDIESETIYQEGETVRIEDVPAKVMIAYTVSTARNNAGLSQAQLSQKTGIDQSDISKIEHGTANPSISTLDRIAKALNTKISFKLL